MMPLKDYRKLGAGIIILSLVFGLTLSSCKKKSKKGFSAPQSISIKTPEVAVGFSHTPTFTVYQVEAGDTVSLFKAADCNQESLLGSEIVADGRQEVDITLDALPALGTYPLYANRMNGEGKTSACSPRLGSYQLIDCPDGLYVPVEGSARLGTNSFCVMVTEAKQGENDIPVPQYAGKPWTQITPHAAKAACKSIPLEHGSCDIISNPQWMTIARDLEATADNWSGGEVGSGMLNRGYHMGAGQTCTAAISDPENPYYGGQTWANKRTFTLSNGSEIWDFSGNAFEWVDWETGGDTFTVAPNTCFTDDPPPDFYTIDCSALKADDYLPANPLGIEWTSYTAANYGVGAFGGTPPEVSSDYQVAMTRGGSCSYSVYAGIFSISLLSSVTSSNSMRGFRCVCTVTE